MKLKEGVSKKLNKEVKRDFDYLATVEPGSEQHTATVKNLKELYEMKQKERELWKDIGLGVLGIGAPLICYNAWYNNGLNFEKTGAVCSSFFRNLLGKFKPTK